MVVRPRAPLRSASLSLQTKNPRIFSSGNAILQIDLDPLVFDLDVQRFQHDAMTEPLRDCFRNQSLRHRRRSFVRAFEDQTANAGAELRLEKSFTKSSE